MASSSTLLMERIRKQGAPSSILIITVKCNLAGTQAALSPGCDDYRILKGVSCSTVTEMLDVN